MEDKCLCEPNEILIFSCAGSSNVGQIGNQTAVKLTQGGLGRYFCLAGIGGHIPGMIESTKGISNVATWGKKIGGSIVLVVGLYMVYSGITL
jgi:uncharacterized metal-binding protein